MSYVYLCFVQLIANPLHQHLVPFHVAIGAAEEDEGVKLLEDYYATLAWGSYGFGLPKDIKMPVYQSKLRAHNEL